MRWLALRALLSAAVLGPGCSYAVSQRPPARPIVDEGECKDDRWPTRVDGVLLVGALGLATVGLGGAAFLHLRPKKNVIGTWEQPPRHGKTFFLGVGLAGLAGSAASAASMHHGLDSARACDDARNQLHLRQWQASP
jgi:hypothetical protein